ncbi:MAG: hypothetical protein AAGI52_01820 [Bacteroidota bacterium]
MPRHTTALLVGVLATLAGCSTSQNPAPSPPVDSAQQGAPSVRVVPSATADDPEARAREVGLTAAQARDLLALGAAVLLPRAMDAWTVDRATTDTEYRPAVGYEVRWRRADGACVTVRGANDGLGGPGYPEASTEVALAELPGMPTVALYRASMEPTSDEAQNWGPGTVISDYVEVGEGDAMMFVTLHSNDEDGCRPLALDTAAPILAGLRPLEPLPPTGDPLHDPTLGRFALDDGVTGDAPPDMEPEQAVRAYFEGSETPVEVETVSESDTEVRVLATMRGLADDSVRDLRYLIVFRERDGAMRFYAAGTQVRCYEGRGHSDWSAERCL